MSDEPIFQSSMPPEGMGGGNLKDLGAAQAGKNPEPPKNKEIKLSKQQELFCHEYLIDFNAAQAAIRAKYSAKTARQIGSRLLTNVDISDKIQELMTRLLHVVSIEATEIVKMVYTMARTAQKEETRLKAMEMLMKHTGAYQLDNEQKDNEIKVNVNIVRDEK